MPRLVLLPRKGMSKKEQRAFKRSKKGGLNKTEKKQTKAIVQNAIKKEHTLKYFNSDDTASAAAPNTSTVGSALNRSVYWAIAQPLRKMTKVKRRNSGPKT